jgi:glycosyltransferase involved in cell wall biosynthesis
LRKKVIFEVHSSLEIEGRLINFIYNNFSVFNSKKLVNLIFITNSLKVFFYKKYKIKNRKYCILPSSSNIRPFILRPQNNKKFKIGYLGYINKSRGFNFICNLSKIDNENEYHVIGGTKSDIYNYKKKFFRKNLFLKSYVPNREVKKYIKKMDLLILPYEKKVQVSGGVGEISKFTSPMKLFDYLASSKPIISSSLPVLNEILKNKKNCIFVNGLNIFKWRLVINKLLNSANQRLIISKNNLNLFKNYTYKIRVKKMFNF